MRVTKIFSFDSAHQLHGHSGKCANLHGHTYRLEVTVEGPVNGEGMVVDFYDLKQIVEERVIRKLDHTFINDIIPVSTAENIVQWVWAELVPYLRLSQLRLWETPSCYVTLQG